MMHGRYVIDIDNTDIKKICLAQKCDLSSFIELYTKIGTKGIWKYWYINHMNKVTMVNITAMKQHKNTRTPCAYCLSNVVYSLAGGHCLKHYSTDSTVLCLRDLLVCVPSVFNFTANSRLRVFIKPKTTSKRAVNKKIDMMIEATESFSVLSFSLFGINWLFTHGGKSVYNYCYYKHSLGIVN